MTPEDPGRLADELEHEADRLERQGREVQGHIDQTRQDWESKRADQSVPGANPPPPASDGPQSDAPATDQPADEEAADEATGEGGPAGVGEPGSTGRDAA